MNRIAKILISLLMTLTVCFAFTACGGSSGSTETAETEDTSGFDIAEAEDSPEWVGQLEQAKDAGQLFVIAGVGKTTAYVSMHQKDENGVWKQIFTTPGFIGKNGLYKEKEGDIKTPVGTYHFNYAFGINEDPGCTAFDYQQVTEDDYWSGDQREGYGYNTMVNIKDLPDLDKEASERIYDYPYHYQYCLNISWNEECIPGKGSGIFLHCLAPQKPYTGGCIAIPKEHMITTLRTVDKDCVVVIDTLERISPEYWDEWDL